MNLKTYTFSNQENHVYLFEKTPYFSLWAADIMNVSNKKRQFEKVYLFKLA